MTAARIRRDRILPDPKAMSFGEHLEELRTRLIWALVGIIPIFLISLYFGGWLLEFLIAPAQAQLRAAGQPEKLQSTGPLEIIGAYFRIATVVTVSIGLPWVIYQAWLFVSPGLYQHEKRFAKFLIPLSFVLSMAGLVFLYFVMLPAMLLFLIQFGARLGEPTIIAEPPAAGLVIPQGPPALKADPVSPVPGTWWFNESLHQLRYAVPDGAGGVKEILGIEMVRGAGIAQQYRVSEYTNLMLFMGLAFAIGFQTPVVVLLAGWLGLVDRKFLTRNRKYALFLAAVAAAILTPSPDPFSMMILAVPLYLLYELGLLMLRVLPAERVAAGLLKPEPASAGDA
jgi:sec-independent protein translocase protein TatC